MMTHEKILRPLFVLWFVLFNWACAQPAAVTAAASTPLESLRRVDSSIFPESPYLPAAGSRWLFVGQDLGAVGGLEDYNEGYVDYVGVPAGVTVYTGIERLAGLHTVDNWQAGDSCAQYYVDSPRFNGVMIAIGLSLVGQLKALLDGELDRNINRLGKWIQAANRPVFLRIGYEFEGAWNHYDPTQYRAAFRKLTDDLRNQGVHNFVTVWQSSGIQETEERLMPYYPGDDYVDWLAYSYFDDQPDRIGTVMLALARKKGLPVFIAEAAPKGRDTLLEDGAETWRGWYEPFFEHVQQNADVTKAIGYINVRWQDQPMWVVQRWGDSRIQANRYVHQHWRERVIADQWRHRAVHSQVKAFVPRPDTEQLRAELTELNRERDVETPYQAELAHTSGNARSFPDYNASSGRVLGYIMAPGDGLWFENAPQAAKVVIRYATPFQGKLGVYVNGQREADAHFPQTGAWFGTYRTVAIDVEIPEGAKLGLQFDKGDRATCIDYLILE